MLFKKLTKQLQALDKTKLKSFRAYLSSDYFGIPPNALLLFEYLEKMHPGFDVHKLSVEAISKKQPRLPNKNAQAKAGTELQKAFDNFLALQCWESKPLGQTLCLMEAQKQLGLLDAFESTAEKYASDLDSDKDKNIEYFNNYHLLTEIEFNGFHARLTRNPNNDLRPVTQTFDAFYAIKKLRYHCELINRHQILGTPYHKENTADLIEFLHPFTNTYYPYVFLFVNIYRMLSADDFNSAEKSYKALKLFIQDYTQGSLNQSMKEAISYLVNYCLHWNNKGITQAGIEAFFWFELQLKHGLLTSKKMMQPADFRAIVSLAISTEKPSKWLKDFIERYHSILPPVYVSPDKDFAMAMYFYYCKEFDKAMPLFQRASAKDEPVFSMIVRRHQFACIYESGTETKEILLDFLVAWERMLYRQAPGLHKLKEVFAAFIRYSRKLITMSDINDREKLLRALDQEPFFAGKEWLVKQLIGNRRQGTEARASAPT